MKKSTAKKGASKSEESLERQEILHFQKFAREIELYDFSVNALS
jgi:hypothetical protein